MKKRIFAVMALAAALCACSKEQPTDSSFETPLIFTATMENTPGSKATLSGMTPSWEVGDQIRVNKEFIYIAQNAGTTATFCAVGNQASGASYEVLFPISYMTGQSFGGQPVQWSMQLPPDELQTWVNGKFDMPMYAKSDDTNLHFKNLCAVLRFTVKDHQMHQVKRLKVANSKKRMFGAFKIDENGAMVLTNTSTSPTPSAQERRRTIIYSEPVPVYEESKVFYFPIVPGVYPDLQFEISEDGETYPYRFTTKYGVEITVERNKIYNINFLDEGATEYITITPGDINNEDFE